MSWESNPEVISTPIQHRKSQKYMTLMFGFLYHGTKSSATKRVRIGSEVPSFAERIPMLSTLKGSPLDEAQRERKE